MDLAECVTVEDDVSSLMVDVEPPGTRDAAWDALAEDPYFSAPACDLADAAPTPRSLLRQARVARRRREDAERDALEIALEWARSHPVTVTNGKPGKAWEVDRRRSCSPEAALSELDPELRAAMEQAGSDRDVVDLVDWYGIPPVAWDAPAALGAAMGLTTFSGKLLMRDALIAAHRLPQIWKQLRAGGAQARQVRKVAERMVGQPADVCEAVDAALAPHLRSYGPVMIDREIDAILQRLHVESRELGLEEEKEKRDVVLDDSGVELTGNAFLGATGDYHDLAAFERMVARVAEILKQQGSTDSLGVRRARAVGILADPHLAATYLDGAEPPRPAKQLVLFLHLSVEALTTFFPLARVEDLGPVLEQMVREWCGRTDTHLTVKPVIDLDGHRQTDAYEIPDKLAEQVVLTHPRCVFAYCRHRSRRCDKDHIRPHNQGGPTCSCNLAPLCRHHHQLKTHAGWRYLRIDETTFLWVDPHGFLYYRDRFGTRHLGDL